MDTEQSTIIEEQNKTVEQTVDADKTVETTQVADKSAANEVVMNEEADQSEAKESSVETSSVAPVRAEQPDELAAEAKEASKVEEVDMLDSTEQPQESNKSSDDLPKDVSTDDAKENSSDVNMDQSNQVISDVKDSVAGVEPVDEPVAKTVEADQSASNSQEALGLGAKSFKEDATNNSIAERKSDKVADAIAEMQAPHVPPKKAKVDMGHLQTRQYLDHTVVPILLSGLSSLAKARPENPIEFLANYLLDNKAKYEHNQENQSLNGN